MPRTATWPALQAGGRIHSGNRTCRPPRLRFRERPPHLREEVANVWHLWKAGIVREINARADVGGVVIVFECKDLAEAQRYVADLPLSKAGLIEWEYISLGAPLPLEFLFDPTVEVGELFDRTTPARGPESTAQ